MGKRSRKKHKNRGLLLPPIQNIIKMNMKRSSGNNYYTDRELIGMVKNVLKENPTINPETLTAEEKEELTLKVEKKFEVILAGFEVDEALFSITKTEAEDRKLTLENVT